jgi:hypothetical protein
MAVIPAMHAVVVTAILVETTVVGQAGKPNRWRVEAVRRSDAASRYSTTFSADFMPRLPDYTLLKLG